MNRKSLRFGVPAFALASLAMVDVAQAAITVTKARIGCLDIQRDGNLTGLVGRSCNGKMSCAYKAPSEDEYKRAGVRARTRSFCTQAIEITYDCGKNDFHTVTVPGDAWKHPAAQLFCKPPAPPTPPQHGGGGGGAAHVDRIAVTSARIGCLDIQPPGNLTGLVARSCNDQKTCSYKAPTEAEYKRAGVSARTRSFCTQAMEITYNCGRNDSRSVTVPGDAWNHPPAQLACNAPPLPSNAVLGPGESPISITKARIGCLDIQQDGNLTRLVAPVCNNRASCSYKAPTENAYRAAGVQAKTRSFCTQAMEITYRCGDSDDQVVTVPGDAWNHPPAEIMCNGKTIATNRQDVLPAPQGTPSEPPCTPPKLHEPEYYLAPKVMLDWAPHPSHGDYTFVGFRPPQPATRDMYNTRSRAGAPGSTLGANEGRVRSELRAVAHQRDAMHALCEAAKRFTKSGAGSGDTPSDREFGNAFADLSVTGKAAFASFVNARPTEASLHAKCGGASPEGIKAALDRAYAVANVLRERHDAPARRPLKWIAVSGEDDQPYYPVNVPSTKFPQFLTKVDVPKFNIPVHTRYMIAHRTPPRFPSAPAPLVQGGPGHVVAADPLPAIAHDAQVILFIHGMDSRAEEAERLTDALHKVGGKNWTVISLDLPTSGYADNLDPGRLSPASAVACHNTPLLDFIEEFIVAFVDNIDGKMGGQLKPKIQAVVGGSLGGNMSMRLGRRPNTPWIRNVIPWSPAAIWPSMIARPNCVACGCDTGWDMLKDRGVNQALKWSGMEGRFLPKNETPELRRELFYGGFDWSPVGGLGGPPQAQCWMSDRWKCKQETILAGRIERHETYDANFRAWHWRLGAEQLAFSQQQFVPGTKRPLYMENNKRMMLFCGYEDTCADLCKHTRDVASKMTNTPGYARFMNHTGHSLDNEYPFFIARQIQAFLK